MLRVVSRQVSVFEVKPFLWDCQDLWSRVLWHPRRPSASYCVELEQYLVHHRYHCNVPRLPTLTKSVIKPTHFAVVADDRPRAHVQRSPHQSPATPDSPMPSLLAAVSGPGRQSHQGGQSFAIPVAQFGKVSHQVSLFRIYRPVNWEFFRIYPPDFQGHQATLGATSAIIAALWN